MSTDTGRGGESGACRQVDEERAEVRGVAASDISGCSIGGGLKSKQKQGD
jgi:hypothetical protein